MRNDRHPDKERVRVEFKRQTLNAASKYAAQNSETLSEYIERLVRDDLAKVAR
jgi:hypothetical protein